MFITRKRLNALLAEAADNAREEMLNNERFNDIYRAMDEHRKDLARELLELHRRIDALDQANKISK